MSIRELREQLEEGPLALFDVCGDVTHEIRDRPHSGRQDRAPGVPGVPRPGRDEPGSYVVVCSEGRECPLAADAVRRLENLGLRNVHLLDGGIADWQAAGLPVVESPHPKVRAWGTVVECRPLVVDRERACGGGFRTASAKVAGAGGSLTTSPGAADGLCPPPGVVISAAPRSSPSPGERRTPRPRGTRRCGL